MSQGAVARRAASKTKWFGQNKKAPMLRPVRYRSSGIPEQMVLKLKYSELVRHTITAGFAQYVWSANGCFDPNITGGGHQPLYFDQQMTLYNHFVVMSSHIKITPATGSPIDLVYAVYVDDDASGTTTATTSWERPGVRVAAAAPGSWKPEPIEHFWKSGNTFGQDVLANSELHGTSGANPTEQSYFIVTFFDPAAGTTSNVDFLYEIWFDVVFFERKDVTGS